MVAEVCDQFLDTVSPSVRRELESRMRIVRAKRGRTLAVAGTRSTDVFLVLEGEAQVLLYSRNGREVSVRQIGVGGIFGELAALDGEARSATVIALTELRLLQISGKDFLRCLETSPASVLWLARRLVTEVRRLTERVFELSALNVQARLHCELLRMAKGGPDHPAPLIIEPAPTHAELANRIGAHREAVTREMRSLVEHNVIRARRRSLEFLDVPRLEHFVGQAVGVFAEPFDNP
jgi:CRP/FNR family transcriptional regulator, cyclic AMP receptor protein